MKKLLFLISVLLLSATTAMAQFSTSDKLYCYKFTHSMRDEVMYNDRPQKDIHVVYFQDNLMEAEIFSETTILDYINNPNKLKAKLKKTIDDYIIVWETKQRRLAWFHEFYSGLSSSSQYTYRIHLGGYYDGYYHDELKWGTKRNGECYTFSADRKKMIWWNIDEPESKMYYELVEWDDLRPNLNFFE